MVKSGITKEEIIAWGGAEVFNQALAMCNSGDVTDIKYDDEKLEISGKIIRQDGWAMPVSLTLKDKGTISSHCPCYHNQKLGQICPHVVAIAIARMVVEMDDEPEERKTLNHKEDADTSSEDDNFIEIPMRPSFYAYLSGSRASLSIALDAWYGDIDFPACSIQNDKVVYLTSEEDPYIRKVRSYATEKEALDSLGKWGFEPGYKTNDLKLYITDPHKVLNFLGAGLPDLRRRGWKVDLSTRLSDLVDTFKSIVPVIKVKDAPNGSFDVQYDFDAPGENISPAEIQAALNRGDAAILKNEKVFLLDNVAIETMHKVFMDCAKDQGDAPAGWFRVKAVHGAYIHAALDKIGDVIDLDDLEAPKWSASAAMQNRDRTAKFEPVALGALENVLRPYQKQGVYWMRFLESAGLCGLLADEMGLGKTLQTLTWLSLPRIGARKKLPSLIVCPTSLVRNWQAEAEKFTPWMKTLAISGPDRAETFKHIPSADIVITSYALIQRDFEEAYFDQEFAAVVLDEAQRIKNRQTKNAKAVKLVRTGQRLVLTGTPVENSVSDVWSIFDFLMPDYLGDYESFKLSFETPISDGGSVASEAQDRLKMKLHPFILRRLKKSVAKDLPDKIIKVSYCPMSEDSQREYNEALAKTRRQAGDMIKAKGFGKSRFELLALLMKLRMIASVGKLDAFLEQLESAIEGGHKILVFSQFVKTLQLIAAELQLRNIEFCYLDGSTKDRLGECNRFNKSPHINVFLISLMAGGTGLNLTGADMVMHYDPWWNPAVEDQATDRAHRIGQKKNVYVMKMIASNTIEEKVLSLQRKKQALIAATVDTTDAAIMENLTAEDLATLLS